MLCLLGAKRHLKMLAELLSYVDMYILLIAYSTFTDITCTLFHNLNIFLVKQVCVTGSRR